MAASKTTSLFKNLVVPAIISLVIFLVLTFLLAPLWRRYRARYSQYLPLDALSQHTSSLRHRFAHRFAALTPLATFLAGPRAVFAHGAQTQSSASVSDLDDAEELDEIDEVAWRSIQQHVFTVTVPDTTRRLSRDLEEGFMDDSDQELD
ncbi:hypothetical protein CDD82_7417 [Ophiocordyceps australis]|uniref:Uncharacterized protein n=1 Tax=Ophiocordyceps australis TaxID=1399860 RepID=A0A2C5XVQ5_9HYPO|nr:hypothetical protein CDD82_7417 [Ophiocordyceps australis]